MNASRDSMLSEEFDAASRVRRGTRGRERALRGQLSDEIEVIHVPSSPRNSTIHSRPDGSDNNSSARSHHRLHHHRLHHHHRRSNNDQTRLFSCTSHHNSSLDQLSPDGDNTHAKVTGDKVKSNFSFSSASTSSSASSDTGRTSQSLTTLPSASSYMSLSFSSSSSSSCAPGGQDNSIAASSLHDFSSLSDNRASNSRKTQAENADVAVEAATSTTTDAKCANTMSMISLATNDTNKQNVCIDVETTVYPSASSFNMTQ